MRSITGFLFDMANAAQFYVGELVVKPLGRALENAMADFGDEPHRSPTPRAPEVVASHSIYCICADCCGPA